MIGDQLVHKLFLRIVDVPVGSQPDQLTPNDISLLLKGILGQYLGR